jgi:prevent-host-death family protein
MAEPRDQSGIGVKDLRARLADVLNETAVYGNITYVTSRGRRIAAIVPVPLAEHALEGAAQEVSAA